jgi:hypothetical protein
LKDETPVTQPKTLLQQHGQVKHVLQPGYHHRNLLDKREVKDGKAEVAAEKGYCPLYVFMLVILCIGVIYLQCDLNCQQDIHYGREHVSFWDNHYPMMRN